MGTDFLNSYWWVFEGLIVPLVCIAAYLFSLVVSKRMLMLSQSDFCEGFAAIYLVNIGLGFALLLKLWFWQRSGEFFPVNLLIVIVCALFFMGMLWVRNFVHWFPSIGCDDSEQNSRPINLLVYVIFPTLFFSLYVSYKLLNLIKALS